jgi:cytochrome P450
VNGAAAETVDVPPFDPFELQDTILGDIRDPWPVLAAARRSGGVQPGGPDFFDGGEDDLEIDVAPGADSFTAYSHEAVTTVLRDAEHFSSEIIRDVVGDTILQMGGEEHRVHRALVSHAFRPKMLVHWEDELIRGVIDALIDKIVDAGHAELVRDLTFNFPVQVIARILGLPQRDFPKFQRWSIEMLSSIVNPERGSAATRALDEYFGAILEARRREPQEDLISELATAELDGERLSDQEIFGFLRILLPAGVETTYRSSGNLLYALLNHPEQLESLAGDHSLIPQAIEEGLRWEPPILFLLRDCVRETELCGTTIGAGAVINVCIGAANRDETRYDAPDRFDILRDAKQHVTFGWGPHMCLGMHLARMETRIAMEAVLERLPGLRLDDAFGAPFVQGSAFRSPPALHVTFG